MLTNSQKQQYERDGFLVIDGFASDKQCGALRERAVEIVEAFDPAECISIFSTKEQTRTTDDYFLASADQISCFFEEEAFDASGQLRKAKEHSINKIGHALHELDPVFAPFSCQSALGALARDLGLQQPQPLQSMYIFKQPGIGGEVVCHQDATFLYTEPQSVTGFWLALEPATQENGCLWALPGGHKLGLKKRWMRNGSSLHFETLSEEPLPIEGLVPLEVAAGTLIVLHGLLPHMSYANRSPRSRHAYALHVIDAACEYPASNWLQRNRPAVQFEEAV